VTAMQGFASSHTSNIVARAEDVQEAYIEQKDRLVNAIDSTRALLSDIREFNKDSWVVRYPHLQTSESVAQSPASGLRRTMSFADDPAVATEVVIAPPKHGGLQRSVTLDSVPQTGKEHEEKSKDENLLSDDFHVLRLDLKLGPAGSSTSPAALVSQLEKVSIANLVDERLSSAIKHIDKLRLRIQDTSSKVLVTGDLNAGKSTFVNALLRREVMPVDQQPCTTLFCEVHDAADNDGKEEVHVIKEGATYSINDESTYTPYSMSELQDVVADSDAQHVLKLYVNDARSPSESLLHNGVVDIALIDAPGLNRDSLKTTAVFARQEEIDVVVFVVSAENHFTLSAKEFLWNASNEKAYLFIVVNRFDQIRDKERCKRLVLEQIKQLSPRTWEDAEDLVHFVDSSSSVDPSSASASFDNLESSLRSFVLVKRGKSKLTPASTYVTHLLSDVNLLIGANAIVAQDELDQAKADLERARPVLEKMRNGRENLEDALESIEDERTTAAGARAKEILNAALDRVGEGQLALSNSPRVVMPSYPGLLRIWEYVGDVRKALLTSIDLAVKLAEDDARATTTAGVKDVADVGEKHLPADVERSKRVFMPEAMFSPRARPGKSRAVGRRNSGAFVAGGLYGLGIGLAQRPEMLEVTFADIVDINHYIALHLGNKHDDSRLDEETTVSALGLASVGLGAVSIASGKALGARGMMEVFVRLSELFGSPTARKWAAPVIGALMLGLTVYFVSELPNTVPRTVGRRLRSTLVKPAEGQSEDTAFVPVQALRVERETRKVLRLASWDLRERFRGAMEERGKEVRGAEDMQKRAEKALEWFAAVSVRASAVRDMAGIVVGQQ